MSKKKNVTLEIEVKEKGEPQKHLSTSSDDADSEQRHLGASVASSKDSTPDYAGKSGVSSENFHTVEATEVAIDKTEPVSTSSDEAGSDFIQASKSGVGELIEEEGAEGNEKSIDKVRVEVLHRFKK